MAKKQESDSPNESKLFDNVMGVKPNYVKNGDDFVANFLVQVTHSEIPIVANTIYEQALRLHPEVGRLKEVIPSDLDDHIELLTKLTHLWKYVQARKNAPSVFPETVNSDSPWKVYYEQNPGKLIEIYETYLCTIESTSEVQSASIGVERFSELPVKVLEGMVDPDSKNYTLARTLLESKENVNFAATVVDRFLTLSTEEIENPQTLPNGDIQGVCQIAIAGRIVAVPIYVKNQSDIYREDQSPESRKKQYFREKNFIDEWKKRDADAYYKTSALPVCREIGGNSSIYMIDLYKLGYLRMMDISDAINATTPSGISYVLPMFTRATEWMSQIESFYIPADIWGKGMVFSPDSPTTIRTYDYGHFESKLTQGSKGHDFFRSAVFSQSDFPCLAYSGPLDTTNPYLDRGFYRKLQSVSEKGKGSTWAEIHDIFEEEASRLPENIIETNPLQIFPHVVSADRVIRQMVRDMSENELLEIVEQARSNDLPNSARSHKIATFMATSKGFFTKTRIRATKLFGLSINQVNELIGDWSKVNLSSVVDTIQSKLDGVLS